MKRVVHLTSAHRRYDQRILWRECCSLQEHGYDVTLIVNDNQENETLDNGVKILSTGFIPQGRWQRMTEGVKRVYELGIAQDANIYHLHDPELLTIALKLKQQRKNVIFDSHEFYGEQIKTRKYIPSLARRFVARSYHSFETYVCKKIDGVVVPSLFDGNEFFQNRAKRIVHIGNYPRNNEYYSIESAHEENQNNVLCSGSLSEERGISVLAEVCQKIGVKLILAGKFSSDEYEKAILDRYSDTVDYRGFIANRNNLFKIYTECSIGACLPLDVGQYSKLDTLPTKVYEYMAMKLPVLSSNFRYRRALIEKYKFGLIADPTDKVEIAEKIKWLINHPKEAEEMGKNGKRLLEEQFTWEYGAEPHLLQLYKEIVSSEGNL